MTYCEEPKTPNPLQPRRQCRDPKHRMVEPAPVTIPEQIVGSAHKFPLTIPMNLSDENAYGSFYSPYGDTVHVAWQGKLPPNTVLPPVEILFRPTTPGAFDGAIYLKVEFADGLVENVRIPISARARALEDAPYTTPAPVRKAPSTMVGSDKPVTADQLAAHTDVQIACQAISVSEALGVDVIAKEAAKFKAAIPERGVWWDLVEFALMLGASHGAAMAGSILSKLMGPAVTKARGGLAKVGAKIGDTLQVHNQELEVDVLFVEGLGTAIEDGIKDLAARSIADLKKPPTPNNEDASSEDAEIEFITQQKTGIRDQATKRASFLNHITTDLMKRSPEISTDAIKAIHTTLALVPDLALKSQTAATAAQWLAFKSRAQLGTESVAGRQVTRTDAVRKRATELTPVSQAAGMLEIAVWRNGTTSTSITGVSVKDVSSNVAQRMLGIDLRALGVPIRLIVNGIGIVTRDEAGRVRVGGSYVTADGTSGPEVQLIQDAESLCNLLLSKTLKNWGIEHVRTNDANE